MLLAACDRISQVSKIIVDMRPTLVELEDTLKSYIESLETMVAINTDVTEAFERLKSTFYGAGRG